MDQEKQIFDWIPKDFPQTFKTPAVCFCSVPAEGVIKAFQQIVDYMNSNKYVLYGIQTEGIVDEEGKPEDNRMGYKCQLLFKKTE
jgi:hypothetical protein